MKMTATDGKSWISAKDANGKILFDGLLLDGESKTFQDDERIDLVLGNAGAIELHVNGKKIDDKFESGQVERLTYTKGDPEAYFEPRGTARATARDVTSVAQVNPARRGNGRDEVVLSPCPNAVPSPLSLLAAPVTRWTRRSSQAAWQRTAGSSSRTPRTRMSPSSTPVDSSRPPRRTPSTPSSKPMI